MSQLCDTDMERGGGGKSAQQSVCSVYMYHVHSKKKRSIFFTFIKPFKSYFLSSEVNFFFFTCFQYKWLFINLFQHFPELSVIFLPFIAAMCLIVKY